MISKISIAILGVVFFVGCSGTMPKLGVNNGQLMLCPDKPNCVNSQATDVEHFIPPIHFIGTRQDAQDRLLQILKSIERTNIIVTEKDYIQVEFTSKVFRFVDDVEFYFPSTKTEKLTINIRSASRLGHSDLGANRKRIENIRNKFKID
ncbi:MAG: hypothetical protein ACI9J4_001338 [Paraglaciecola sp.]|jgi:uncharacterized protein (DUF1499 family)